MIVQKDDVKFVTRTDLAVAMNEFIDTYNNLSWTLKLNIVCKEYDDTSSLFWKGLRLSMKGVVRLKACRILYRKKKDSYQASYVV